MSSIKQQSLSWRRSSACASGECVEVAYCEDRVLVRSSAAPDIALEVPCSTWVEFIAYVIESDPPSRSSIETADGH